MQNLTSEQRIERLTSGLQSLREVSCTCTESHRCQRCVAEAGITNAIEAEQQSAA